MERVAFIHTRLIQELPEAISEFEMERETQEASVAKENVTRAHSRLNDFLRQGNRPQDLKGRATQADAIVVVSVTFKIRPTRLR